MSRAYQRFESSSVTSPVIETQTNCGSSQGGISLGVLCSERDSDWSSESTLSDSGISEIVEDSEDCVADEDCDG